MRGSVSALIFWDRANRDFEILVTSLVWLVTKVYPVRGVMFYR